MIETFVKAINFLPNAKLCINKFLLNNVHNFPPTPEVFVFIFKKITNSSFNQKHNSQLKLSQLYFQVEVS